MGFSEAVKSVFSKYATITGRACRSEYWYFTLFYIIVYAVLALISVIMPFLIILSIVFGIAIIIPSLTVSIRRLHDRNQSGWWLLVGLIPMIGGIIMLIWFAMRGTDGPNDFGDDPLGYSEDAG